MEKLTLAILSDLHVGHGARARDLCPDPSTQVIESGFQDTFVAFLKDKKIRADYLILPGDVSHRAQPDEFFLASEVIKKFADALHIPKKKILFVPGNHDVDWAVMSLPGSHTTEFRRKQRYAALRNTSWLFGQTLRRPKPHVLDEPYFTIWDLPDILVAGYNSSWHDDQSASVHNGLISNKAIAELENFLNKIDLSSRRLRLFLVHHHPIQYSDPIPDEPDFSIMTNSENLLSLLQRKRFDFLIHGHKHSPRFKTYLGDSGHPLGVLCAGSFSAQLDTRWSGYVNNQFHIVEILGRDNASDCIYGFVKSWTYLYGQGWIESQANNGIRHILPFGTYMLPSELEASLRPVLIEMFSTREYITWSEVVSKLPRLEHLPPDRIMDTLGSLGKNLGFHKHGDPPDEIILLKERGK